MATTAIPAPRTPAYIGTLVALASPSDVPVDSDEPSEVVCPPTRPVLASDATLLTPDVIVETTLPAPSVTVEYTPTTPEVMVEATPPAPDVISVAREVATLSPPDVMVENTPPAPEVTSDATLVATLATLEVTLEYISYMQRLKIGIATYIAECRGNVTDDLTVGQDGSSWDSEGIA